MAIPIHAWFATGGTRSTFPMNRSRPQGEYNDALENRNLLDLKCDGEYFLREPLEERFCILIFFLSSLHAVEERIARLTL